jgi:glyoxylase-like metal-dependent hydrolase (beta-lactamase superfamily II)
VSLDEAKQTIAHKSRDTRHQALLSSPSAISTTGDRKRCRQLWMLELTKKPVFYQQHTYIAMKSYFELLLYLGVLLPSCIFAFQISLPTRSSLAPIQNVLFESIDSSSNDDIPTMDWLTDSLATKEEEKEQNINNNLYIEEHDADGFMGDVPIPTTGISVADEMEKTQKERFFTEVVSIKGLEPGIRAAQIVTTTTSGSFDPVRYVVGLSKQPVMVEDSKESSDDDTTKPDGSPQSFVLVDVPPFSDQLACEIRDFMGPNGKLDSILVTSKDCIHYDEAPGVYAIRRADLVKWEKAFPDAAIVAYRMDVPRDCRDSITQRLDGYGPFALDESSPTNVTFVETGRPLTYEEWDYDLAQDVFAGKEAPPDDSNTTAEEVEIEEDLYSAEAIRSREEGKRVLAVYTPGRTYGSISYVFPEVNLVASGFTIPVEDSRNEENIGVESAGPALDVRGYITTSKTGITRQMESARNLIESYGDRYNVILPSRSDPYFLDGDTEERKQELLRIVDQYEKIGKIYERLGITSYDDEEDS